MTERDRRPLRAATMRITADDRQQLITAAYVVGGIATAVVLFFASTKLLASSVGPVVRGAVVPLAVSILVYAVSRLVPQARIFGRSVVLSTVVVIVAVFVAYGVSSLL